MSVAIAGASGYTGIELLRVLSLYREVNISQITSRQFAGKTLSEVFPVFLKNKYQDLIFQKELDTEVAEYYFLALPHDASLETVKVLLEKGKKVIDLSGAYRIKDKQMYPEFYGFEHIYPDVLDKAVYGLPEVFREEIKRARIVANPGCYPTSVLLGLFPVILEGVLEEETVIVNSLSGISGAGRTPKQHFHYPEAYSDAYPYNLIKHRHTPEVEDVVFRFSGRKLYVRFTPHIIPVSRGMLSTITFKTSLNREKLRELYLIKYATEPFIRLLDSPPHIKSVIGSNYCDIYVDKDERTGAAVVCSAIDNLGKGASTQAIQNFNLMAGISEDMYLSDISLLFP
ncbi:MAG: N-acetyl-gamma-glutamyl-phosphate reductase [Hydrogenothermaceae bacterium]|nr:N-acetyl-gamma-glutamyl-phosphate reductase [Hydrogenothermaceae bacterium]